MGLDVSDDYIQALSFALMSSLELGLCFAHTCGITEENLKMTASSGLLLRLHLSEELFGVRAARLCAHPELFYPIQG